MLPYNLRLAFASIRRNPILSALMVAAIAVGIGASMTTLTIYYMAAKNPIPHKSDVLYHVQMDNMPMGPNYEPDEDPRDQISFTDATNLLEANRAERQAAMFKASFALQPANRDIRPFLTLARVTGNDFFEMFDVPFLYGGPWDDAIDASPQQQVVLSRETNDKLFGGENSVGREVRLDDHDFRVVGVIDRWDPSPKFFDLTNGPFMNLEDMYIPFSLTVPLELDTSGNTSCGGGPPINGYDEFLRSECVWITFWAQLQGGGAEADFRQFIEGYITQQKQLGRFERPMNYRVRNVAQWLEDNEVASDSVKVMVWLSFLFLVVCLLNTVGLILAKFTGRAPEVALRRALGASRGALFRQHLVEVLTIGALGGLAGIGLALAGLYGIRFLRGGSGADQLFVMDWNMVLTSVLVAMAASAAAGIYPALRIGRVAPARYLKTQ